MATGQKNQPVHEERLGRIKAVVWVDALQMLLYLLGALVAAVVFSIGRKAYPTAPLSASSNASAKVRVPTNSIPADRTAKYFRAASWL